MSAIDLLIGVVGPCSAGKTTLIAGLSVHGYNAKHIAQEHSYVPDMWERLAKPGVLIFLDVSYPVSMNRRPLDMSVDDFSEQCTRLEHARQHADLYIFTDELTPQQVLLRTLNFIKGFS
jgi:hypothetical protein